VQIDFDWDPAKAASNAAKHGVTFEAAITIFRDPLARSILDRDRTPDEERWVTLGETAAGHLLVVVHTWNEINLIVRWCASSRPGVRLQMRRGNTVRIRYHD
jgi:hypothetical protein